MNEKLTKREQVDIDALRFLEKGPDTIGVIDAEEKLAAAIVFLDLEKRGLAVRYFENGKPGPTYAITPAGRAALREQKDACHDR